MLQHFSGQDNIIYSQRLKPSVKEIVMSFLITKISNVIRKNYFDDFIYNRLKTETYKYKHQLMIVNHLQAPVRKPAPIISSNNKPQTKNKKLIFRKIHPTSKTSQTSKTSKTSETSPTSFPLFYLHLPTNHKK